MTNWTKNQVVIGEVVDLTSDGDGVVKVEGFPFFVGGVIPNETVEFIITKVKKSFGYGKLQRVIEESNERVPLIDDIGRQIGTMPLQHIQYEAQLRYKQQQVQQVFERIGHFNSVEVKPVIGMVNPWHYRNKAQIPVREVKGELITGFFRKNSHQLVPVEDFHIQYESIDKAIMVIRNILRQYNVTAYNEMTHKGMVRHIIVKQAHYTRQMMVLLVLNTTTLPHQDTIIEAIIKELPDVVSISLNINQARTNVILGKQSQLIYGQPYYEDSMLGLQFRIGSHSFYQVNTPQAETLYNIAIQLADIQPDDVVLDAYCGIGTMTLAFSRHARQVYGMEVVPEAIELAKENAQLNNCHNVTFEVGKAEVVLPKWHEEGIQFDVVVVDPPRKGLDPRVIETIVAQQSKRIVYVSCNPATCARDCHLIAQSGYTLDIVQPVDLFPQTGHVECVVLMTRK